jgi:hypothetical protein
VSGLWQAKWEMNFRKMKKMVRDVSWFFFFFWVRSKAELQRQSLRTALESDSAEQLRSSALNVDDLRAFLKRSFFSFSRILAIARADWGHPHSRRQRNRLDFPSQIML